MQGTANLLTNAGTRAAGKTPRPDASGVPGSAHSRLFYVSDRTTHTRFLVDTGSEVSAIPPSPADRRRSPDNLTLMAVNDTPIRTYGKQSLTSDSGDRYLGFSSSLMYRSPSLVLIS